MQLAEIQFGVSNTEFNCSGFRVSTLRHTLRFAVKILFRKRIFLADKPEKKEERMQATMSDNVSRLKVSPDISERIMATFVSSVGVFLQYLAFAYPSY